jgi:hypothetical protein
MNHGPRTTHHEPPFPFAGQLNPTVEISHAPRSPSPATFCSHFQLVTPVARVGTGAAKGLLLSERPLAGALKNDTN